MRVGGVSMWGCWPCASRARSGGANAVNVSVPLAGGGKVKLSSAWCCSAPEADLRRFVENLGDATLAQRFGGALSSKQKWVDGLLTESPGHIVITATSPTQPREILAVLEARPFGRDDPVALEVSIVVADGAQRQGIGRALVSQVVLQAENRNVERLVAQPNNASRGLFKEPHWKTRGEWMTCSIGPRWG